MALRVRRGLLLATAASLVLATGLVAWVGWRDVLQAITAIGWGGFAVFTLYWLPVMVVAGLAWAVSAAGAGPGRAGVFVWGRLVRESAADVLPFSQVGGFLVGGRVVMAAGVAEEIVLASTLVDLAAEIAAQALYTLIGVGLMLARLKGDLPSEVLWPAIGGLALLLVGVLAVALGHRRAVGALGRVVRRWLPDSVARAEAVTLRVEQTLRRPGRMTAAVVLHLAGWIGGGGASYLALRFMGADVPFWTVIAVESLMYAVRNLGFALPGGLGVQEGAYVLLGPVFGLHASDALALSLLRRGRDLVIGLPVLAIWQAREGRLLLDRRRKRPDGAASER